MVPPVKYLAGQKTAGTRKPCTSRRVVWKLREPWVFHSFRHVAWLWGGRKHDAVCSSTHVSSGISPWHRRRCDAYIRLNRQIQKNEKSEKGKNKQVTEMGRVQINMFTNIQLHHRAWYFEATKHFQHLRIQATFQRVSKTDMLLAAWHWQLISRCQARRKRMEEEAQVWAVDVMPKRHHSNSSGSLEANMSLLLFW